MKAQTGIEFMILFGIFLVAILILLFAVWGYIFDINISTNDLHANSLIDTVSSKVETVFLEGDGFSTNYIMPEKLLGKNYSLDIQQGFVYLNFSERSYMRRLITRNVTGVLNIGSNIIKNVNGIVVIS